MKACYAGQLAIHHAVSAKAEATTLAESNAFADRPFQAEFYFVDTVLYSPVFPDTVQ